MRANVQWATLQLLPFTSMSLPKSRLLLNIWKIIKDNLSTMLPEELLMISEASRASIFRTMVMPHPELKNLQHERHPLIHQSSPSTVCCAIYSIESIRLCRLIQKRVGKASLSVTLLHLLIYNLQLSLFLPPASHLLASTPSHSPNSPSVKTERKKTTTIKRKPQYIFCITNLLTSCLGSLSRPRIYIYLL